MYAKMVAPPTQDELPVGYIVCNLEEANTIHSAHKMSVCMLIVHVHMLFKYWHEIHISSINNEQWGYAVAQQYFH